MASVEKRRFDHILAGPMPKMANYSAIPPIHLIAINTNRPTLWVEEEADMTVRLVTVDREKVLGILMKTDLVAFLLPNQILKRRPPEISLMSQMEQTTKRLQRAHQQLVVVSVHQ